MARSTGVSDEKLVTIQPDEADAQSARTVRLAFLALGIVVIFPWNCILSATDFLNGSAFPDRSWPLYATQVYQTVFLISQVVMITFGSHFGPCVQFLLPLVGCVFSTAALILSGLEDDNEDVRFMVSLLALALLGASMGIMQAALFGVAAQGIKRFGNLPGQIMIGMGLAGIAAMILALSTQAIFHTTRASFIVLFAAVIVASFLTVLLFKSFKRTRDSSTLDVSHDSHEERQAPEEGELEEWTKCRSISAGLTYELAVFCVFAVTFMVFPSQCAQWKGQGPISASSYITIVMGDFQVMDTLGRWSAENVVPLQRLGTPLPLWILTISRIVFVPAFIFCARSSEGLWSLQAIQLLLMALLAFTNGLASSLAMQFAPRHVPAPARGTVGMAMTLALVGGIAGGSYLAMPFGRP